MSDIAGEFKCKVQVEFIALLATLATLSVTVYCAPRSGIFLLYLFSHLHHFDAFASAPIKILTAVEQKKKTIHDCYDNAKSNMGFELP
jgi:hypothetical protein